MHPLEQLQNWLQAVITHPRGIAPGIESEDAQREIGVTPDEVEQVICPSQALSSIQRLEIYGNAYYARLLECLGESFPVLKQAVGEELFNQFAFGYLQRYPSKSYTLAHLGEQFADYLQETRPDREGAESGEVGWPDLLIDLARLDWNIAAVFDGPGVEDQPVLAPSDVAAIPPDQWPLARLVAVPCLRLLEFRYQVNDYFTAVRAGEEPELPAAAASYLALTRINYVVRRIPLSRPQYELLSAVLEGKAIGEAIGRAAAASDDDLPALADDLRDWFRQWAEARLFQRVELAR